ncbi:MAG: WecB/TagA/CpsF family glycosyltransferase [Roseiflexaceae bacterium]
MRKSLIILGVPVDDLTMEQALERLDQLIQTGRETGRCHQVATVNADFVVNSLRDPELRFILQASDMTTADGAPLVWGARLLGVPLRDRVTGADLVPQLAERAAERGYSIYLLGAAPGVAARAALRLQQRHPNLRIVGVASPPNRPVLEMDRSIIDEIRAAQPDILLVAFGNPKQEKWISMHRHELGVPVCIGVGGTLDMIAGVTKRAPRWMQQSGLEWLFRLLQEPRRLWRRYVTDLTHFSVSFAQQWWGMRAPRPTPADAPQLVAAEHAALIRVSGRLDASNQAALVAQAERALALDPTLVIDLSGATFLDSSALGALVALANRAREQGGALRLACVPPRIAQTLALVRLERFFEIYPDVERALGTQRPPAPEPPAPPLPEDGWAVQRMPRLLDAATVPVVLERCTADLARNPRLVLDFSETVFLSSAGMAAIARLTDQSRQQGGELRVAGCSPDLLRGLRLVKLDAVVPLYHDVHAAVGQC